MNIRDFKRLCRVGLLVSITSGAAAACSPQVVPATPQHSTTQSTATPRAVESVLPGAKVVPGWASTGEAKSYDRDNLFSLVDGQADGFFVYGFERVATQRYKSGTGTIVAEVWQLATPADAFGLFTTDITGQAANIGNDGDSDPGHRLSFWQDRYTVHVSALDTVDDTALWALAKAIAAALPPGGERPALLSSLPNEGLQDRSALFFHQELSIQDAVWLGGENILGLSRDTNGVVARYQVDGQTARLMLVEYPNVDQVAPALAALKSSAVKDLAAADSRDRLLGAVFGKIASSDAAALVSRAIAAQ
ncbi:MAG: hypothetical protein M1482_03285 [Chloroflexi bacterium]|nr:hypothetical protein [Chloroflexota bacterium]